MTANEGGARKPFRGSPAARAIGSIIFCGFIVGYVTIITLDLMPRLPERRAMFGLLFVWLVALLAVGIIARAWLRSRASGTGSTTAANIER